MFEFSKKGSPEDTPARETTHPDATPAAEASPRARPAPVSGARREAAIIGPSIQLDGDLRGQEDLLIEGEVNGTVQLRNNSLTVGSQGKVQANVYAKEIHVEGSVDGDLFASERVSVRRSAQVHGNITSPRVVLEEGARFKGSIEMDSEAVEAALGTSAKASPASPRTAAAPAPRTNATESRDKPAGSPPGGAARSGVTS